MTHDHNFRTEMAAPGLHSAILREIDSLFANLDGKRVLDAPCGQGAIAEKLACKGAIVDGLDLIQVTETEFGVNYVAADLEIIQLPIEEYDLAISVEGIEHLQNPMAWFEKLARSVKPGGLIILSTPNPDAISSRWKSFIRGYHQYFNLTPIEVGSFRTSGHIHPIYFSFIEWACLRSNVEFVDIKTKSRPLPRMLRSVLYNVFYKSFPPMIMPLINGSVGIYTLRKKQDSH